VRLVDAPAGPFHADCRGDSDLERERRAERDDRPEGEQSEPRRVRSREVGRRADGERAEETPDLADGEHQPDGDAGPLRADRFQLHRERADER
jgi:hypothetical protein